MCVRLSHRNLHGGECLTLYIETWNFNCNHTWSCPFLSSLCNNCSSFYTENKSISLIYNQLIKLLKFIHVIRNYKCWITCGSPKMTLKQGQPYHIHEDTKVCLQAQPKVGETLAILKSVLFLNRSSKTPCVGTTLKASLTTRINFVSHKIVLNGGRSETLQPQNVSHFLTGCTNQQECGCTVIWIP